MTCAACNDTGWLIQNRAVVDCACKVERRRVAAYARAGIPERYRDKGWDSYDPKVSRAAAAGLMMAKKYAEEWPTRPGLGMLLTGPVGVGKTHLTCVILRECAERWNARIVFVDLPELLARIKSSFDQSTPETEAKILRPILEADILAVDEIGAARSTDWAYATTENLINGRYNSRRSTLLTTNFPNFPSGYAPPRAQRPAATSDFQARLSDPTPMQLRRETLGDRIGDRMWSRVQEMCVVVEMDGPDQRLEAARRRG